MRITVMDEFAARLGAEVPIFKSSFETLINALTETVLLESESKDMSPDKVESSLSVTEFLATNLTKSLPTIIRLKNIIGSIPNISSKHTESTRKVVGGLDSLINEYTVAIKLITEAQSVIKGLQTH